MSEAETVAIETRADTAPSDSEAKPSPRAAVLRFVAAFIVLVMTFLIGYRYAMDTPANVWYLFQVAKHTAWALGVAGESAEVEPMHEAGPPGRRADLARWKAERGGGTTPVAVSEDPITAWESWQWKAYSVIRDGETIAEDGPIVLFVLAPGATAQQESIRRELERVRADARASGADASAEISRLEKRLQELTAQITAIQDPAERNRANRGSQFAFHVVPDCGAIPSMSIFLAAVLAFPAAWWKRGVGAIGGLVILYGINILRLGTLGYIGAIDTSPGRKWFTFAHEYVWQGVFIVFVVAVWMLWVEWFVRPRRT